jgi:hypothetical protein
VISNLLLNQPQQNRPDLGLTASFETDPSPGAARAQLTFLMNGDGAMAAGTAHRRVFAQEPVF